MRRTPSLLIPTVGACAALSLLRCSLTEDLGTLNSGRADAAAQETSTPPPVEASAPGVDAGGVDATPEAAPPAEASSPPPDSSASIVDASEEPGPVNEPPTFLDGGVSWCTSHTADSFCADFDQTPLPSLFSSLDGTLVSLTSTTPSSAPNALLLFAPPNPGTGTFASKVSKDFPSPVTSINVEFDFRAELLNTTSSGLLFAAVDFVDNVAARYSVRLAFNSGAPRLEESYLGSPPDIYHTNFSIPLSTWSRIRMQITFAVADGGADGAAPQASSALYVDGEPVGQDALSPPVGAILRPTVLIGAVYGTLPHTGWTLRYDNITVDAP